MVPSPHDDCNQSSSSGVKQQQEATSNGRIWRISHRRLRTSPPSTSSAWWPPSSAICDNIGSRIREPPCSPSSLAHLSSLHPPSPAMPSSAVDTFTTPRFRANRWWGSGETRLRHHRRMAGWEHEDRARLHIQARVGPHSFRRLPLRLLRLEPRGSLARRRWRRRRWSWREGETEAETLGDGDAAAAEVEVEARSEATGTTMATA